VRREPGGMRAVENRFGARQFQVDAARHCPLRRLGRDPLPTYAMDHGLRPHIRYALTDTAAVDLCCCVKVTIWENWRSLSNSGTETPALRFGRDCARSKISRISETLP
jgi:hypothetical protein